MFKNCDSSSGPKMNVCPFQQVLLKNLSWLVLTILKGKTCVSRSMVLLNSVKEFIKREAWLLLTFFISLHNQLSSIHSIVTA